jgi:transcriptional regulator with XRE-family HTH domain
MINENLVYVLIGKKIKDLREKSSSQEDKSFSQEKLAESISVSRASIANYESGKQSIYISDLYKIADVLNVEINSLLPSLDETRLKSPEKIIEQSENINEKTKKELENFIKKTEGGDSS